MDGKLHVLHFTVVILKLLIDIYQFLIDFRHFFCQICDGMGCADTRYNVFTLGVHEILAVKDVFTGGRITCKGNACTGVVTHVTKDHRLNVYSCTPIMGNVVDLTITNSPGGIPRPEDCIDGTPELFERFGREKFPGTALDNLLVFSYQFLQGFYGQFVVQLHTLLFPLLGQCCFEEVMVNTHDNVAVHLDKTTVRVPSKTWVVGLFSQCFNRYVVETQV